MAAAMEELFRGRSLFVTGATGFLGKVLVEKLLRCVPTVDKIFLLIRPRKGVEPAARLQKDVVDSPIFDRLRRELGPEVFAALAAAKLHAVGGDVTSPGLGLSPADAEMLRAQVELTVHSAATVSFNEPLEVAVEMNVVGALNAARFVRSCPRVVCHVHVSTAYVNSNRRELRVREQLYPLEFDPAEALDSVTRASPSELERLRVHLMGTYPNTYALTKSMAEHLLTRELGPDFPLVIFRPTIIGAAWKEPVPGWVDQVAGAGAIFLAVGMGVLTMLPGDPRNTADVVPVDLAVNSILLSMLARVAEARAAPRHGPLVVHCGTSDPRQNPLRWRIPCGVVVDYFRENPPKRALFPAKFNMIPTHQSFQLQWFLAYALPSSVYSTVANKTSSARHVKDAAQLWQLTWRARTLVELFKPFTENQWVFAADASENELKPLSSPVFWLDAREIVWERYMVNFCVGLKKFVLREDVIDVDIEGVEQTQLALSTGRMLAWDPDHHAISFPGLLSDVAWAYTSSRKPGYTTSGVLGRVMGLTGWREGKNHEASHVPRRHVESVGGLRNAVLEAAGVREAILQQAEARGQAIDDVEQQAAEILDTMAAKLDYRSVRKFGWLLRKVCRNLYDAIHVDERGLSQIRELLLARDGADPSKPVPSSVVLVPTHRSYVDFLLMSYVFFAYNMPVPYIAAGEDFLNMGALTELLRASGAYFIRRSFADDPLYAAVFRAYTQYLVSRGHTLEFFIEGSRSRSGKQLHPKFGILGAVVDSYLSEQVQNVHVVPVTIDYEKPLEVLLHQNELLGEGKVRESLGALLRSSVHVAHKKFGSISVQFGEPIDVAQFVNGELARHADSFVSSARVVERLAYAVTSAMIAAATCTMSNVVATLLLMYRQGISRSDLVQQADWLRLEILRRGGRVTGTQGRAPRVVVDRALELLGELVCTRRKDIVEPAIASREQYANMIGLGYYRNKLLHWFNRDGVFACAFHALEAFQAEGQVGEGVDRQELLDGALFLHDLLRMEFVRPDDADDSAELAEVLRDLESRGALERGRGDRLRRGDTRLLSLLSTLIWPFIDSYWVTVTSLFALRPGGAATLDDLLKRVQWLAETMYHEKLLAFYESCSLETLQNAVALLHKWGVLETQLPAPASPKRKRSNRPSSTASGLVRLTPEFEQGDALERLALRIAKFRKQPLAGSLRASTGGAAGRESQLIAYLPTLSKM